MMVIQFFFIIFILSHLVHILIGDRHSIPRWGKPESCKGPGREQLSWLRNLGKLSGINNPNYIFDNYVRTSISVRKVEEALIWHYIYIHNNSIQKTIRIYGPIAVRIFFQTVLLYLSQNLLNTTHTSQINTKVYRNRSKKNHKKAMR